MKIHIQAMQQVTLLVKTHHRPTDSSTGGLFEFVQEFDDDDRPGRVTVVRLHDREPWGVYASTGTEDAWDMAVKHVVHRLETDRVTFERYDTTPLWEFLAEHAAYVVPMGADQQSEFLTSVAVWDHDAGDWRRSHPAFTPFDPDTVSPLHYSLAWQSEWAAVIEEAALRYVRWGYGADPSSSAPAALWDSDDDATLYFYEVCKAIAQWGDRDECSFKHAALGVRALLDGRHWHEVDDYESPGGLFGTDAEATEQITYAWDCLESHLRGAALVRDAIEEVANA